MEYFRCFNIDSDDGVGSETGGVVFEPLKSFYPGFLHLHCESAPLSACKGLKPCYELPMPRVLAVRPEATPSTFLTLKLGRLGVVTIKKSETALMLMSFW